MRRARDLMDREYAEPLDVPATVRAALMSPSHFARQFPAAYGETPYSYRDRRSTRPRPSFRTTSLPAVVGTISTTSTVSPS
ncbi:hypothetical protein SY2F82_33700 [Streptomyces sp. Y2F8-2]|nr:hypothetical protein SY2F82_33700 [Streptomyces sp. Y2F8-2]